MWVDWPPPDTRGSRDADVDHAATAAALRRRPGQWAWLIGFASASVVRTGAAYRPSGSYEAVVRHGHLYVRYIGAAIEHDGRADVTGEVSGA